MRYEITDPEAESVNFGLIRNQKIVELGNYIAFLSRKLKAIYPVGDTFNHYLEQYREAVKDLEVQLAYRQAESE